MKLYVKLVIYLTIQLIYTALVIASLLFFINKINTSKDLIDLEIDYGKNGVVLVKEDDLGIKVNPMDLTPTPREP